MKRLLSLIICIIVASGCESDLAKLQRLNSEQLVSCLNAQSDYKALQDVRPDPRVRTPKSDSIASEWVEWQAKCELAAREYEGFKR